MTLFEAFMEALYDDTDPPERVELMGDQNLKTAIAEEIVEALKESSQYKGMQRAKPISQCILFFFLIGIRVGRILEINKQASPQ